MEELSEGEDISDEILRKTMYCLSKFYAAKILNDITLLKNLLAISIQNVEENKNGNYFILTVILNLFHNRDIFTFLMDSNNNSQFNFLKNILEILILNFFNHDVKIKQQVLEIISIFTNFSMPSLSQEQFLKNFLSEMYVYQMGNKPLNETDTFSFFVDRLYKDFKTHDFDEFELQFLDTVLNMITFEPLLKKVINNFDFLLYLLNRRLKPQRNLLEKVLYN